LQGSDTNVTSVEPTENVEQEDKWQQPKAHPTHRYKFNILVCHAPQLLEQRILIGKCATRDQNRAKQERAPETIHVSGV
jgi:hypothetical protein